MNMIEVLQTKQTPICVVGLGYVGLPLAVLLSKHFSVIGLDISAQRIEQLRDGFDKTGEVESNVLQAATIDYTTDAAKIADAGCIIVAVPTPITEEKEPDVSYLVSASRMVGEHMERGSVVVFESTVYPGATEDVCIPEIEKASGLVYGKDFTVGYSPERVNPGDKEHTIDTIVKVISGTDPATVEVLEAVYGAITQTYAASSIRVAEAAKVIENTQRDLNIALMNELALICGKLDMSVYDVLAAAGTKWNFLPFTPGLVGGHCIGVDPYYLTHKAKQLGYDPQVILAGRAINDVMPAMIADRIVAAAKAKGIDVASAKVTMLGCSFKENVPDVRNSKVIPLYERLAELVGSVTIFDPIADAGDVMHEYGVDIVTQMQELPEADIVVVAVAHDAFVSYSNEQIFRLLRTGGLVADIKQVYTRDSIDSQGFSYWTL